jgi:hypothetical protein
VRCVCSEWVRLADNEATILLTWQARTKETVSMRRLRPLRTVSQRYGLFVV